MARILIADDDTLLLQALGLELGREGYQVLTVEDGARALETIREECPDMVILEMALPGLDGLAICRMIRRDSRFTNVAIIMLTTRGAQVDKMVALDSGADDYVLKPYEIG